MFTPVQHSCGNLWAWGFHTVSDSLSCIYHRSPSAWGLEHYNFSGNLLSHPHLYRIVWCGGSGVYEWPCRQNGCHGLHIRGPVYWACLLHIQSWNASFTSSIHPCTYTHMVYCGIPSILECCSEDLVCSFIPGERSHVTWSTGHKTSGKYERFAS